MRSGMDHEGSLLTAHDLLSYKFFDINMRNGSFMPSDAPFATRCEISQQHSCSCTALGASVLDIKNNEYLTV